MRKMLWLLPLASLAATPAQAAAPAPAWQGLWQGTIGELPVRACLSVRGDDSGLGSYYYMSKLVPIAIRQEEGKSVWAEQNSAMDDSGASWTIANAGAQQLSGQWRSGSRTLAIALTRVAFPPNYDGPCYSAEFQAPRVKPVRVTSAAATNAGVSYTKQTYDVGPGFPDASIAGFAIREQQPGDRAINAALRLDLTKPDTEYLDCDRLQVAQQGIAGAYSYEAQPDLLTAEFLSASISSGGDCGGAHPDDSTFHRTFDRRSGRAIDLGTWFTARGVKPWTRRDDGPFHEIRPALRSVVLRHFKFDDSECREAVGTADLWDIALGRAGLTFTPSLAHVVVACEEPATVPFRELTAWLSPAGRQGVARMGVR